MSDIVVQRLRPPEANDHTRLIMILKISPHAGTMEDRWDPHAIQQICRSDA